MDPFPFPFPRKSALPSCDSEAAALTPDIRLLLFLADPFLLASPSRTPHAALSPRSLSEPHALRLPRPPSSLSAYPLFPSSSIFP